MYYRLLFLRLASVALGLGQPTTSHWRRKKITRERKCIDKIIEKKKTRKEEEDYLRKSCKLNDLNLYMNNISNMIRDLVSLPEAVMVLFASTMFRTSSISSIPPLDGVDLFPRLSFKKINRIKIIFHFFQLFLMQYILLDIELIFQIS